MRVVRLLLLLGLLALGGCNLTSPPATTMGLSDFTRQLEGYGQAPWWTPVPAGAAVTLQFLSQGGFEGDLGSGYYGGGCRFQGNKLSVPGLTATSQTDELEQLYLPLLRRAETWEATPARLIIHSSGAQDLVVKPA